MYKRLSEQPTKQEYCKLIEETIILVEDKLQTSPLQLFQSIYAQILDIQKYIIEYQSISDKEEIFERYTIGAIAIKNIEDDNELRERLCDIFAGALEYHTFHK